ncbi:hypothetical protein Tco_0515687, partial [Tanacetum coccineum]
RRKPKSKPTPTKILHFEEPDESQVNTEKVQRRKGKDPMTEEDLQAEVQASKKSKELQEEREQYSVEERAKFLHDTIAAQRKFLAE